MTKKEISIFNTNDFYECITTIEKYWNKHYGTFDIEEKRRNCNIRTNNRWMVRK